ncbi:MAG: hypothetical protein K8R76_07995 [Candidatus Aegiribacteria sp.]|nr:hypothetical protein [Candidatus Aegiribacteria sp.]
MSRIIDVLWILVRIGGFWIAVSGFGRITRIGLRKSGYDAPVIFLGLVSLLVLSVPLSFLGLFNRSVLSFILIAGALLHPAYFFTRKRIHFSFKYPGFHTLILLLITVFIVITNTMRASEPQTNPDALTAYAVQPDRWLSSGRIYYIEESMFSGLPSVGEVLAAWPASLSSSRTDQLSLLQVFQMCMLLFSAIAAWTILGKGRNGLLITVIACMATSMLAGWASLPKIEMTVLYFSTVAICLLYRGYVNKDGKFDPVPFLAMGLALGTKLTAYVLLPSFLLLAYAIPIHRKMKTMFVWCIILAAIPLTFAVRTMIHTGAPFYPISISFFSADEDHFLPEIPEMTRLARENAAPTDLLVNTEPEPLSVNISDLVSSWGLPAVLFLLGMASLAMRQKLSLVLLPLAAVLIYCLIASVVFNPLSWGAKYAFLMSPFMAATGAKWSEKLVLPRLSFYAFLLVMALTSSLLPRFRYAVTFPGMSSSLDFRHPNIVTVKALHDWCNTNLPEGSRLLSMWKRERYFSDHDIIVIENHPIGRRLFLADSIEEEMELLDLMDIDYVYYQTSDPMPGDLENGMEFLFSDRLETIAEVNGFTICGINY